MEFLLGYFDEVPIEGWEIVELYAVMDSDLVRRGHVAGENDLWIAASAIQHDETLLTMDKDFDRMSRTFLTVESIEPNL